ncbi:BZ3500_MvSof-1268-A1-R1_Chr1-3g02461 [Microbotryum saponariae]|uniref:Putative phospholipase n=1 Tax=Microbotryum saponariae TaxID=289078 RepID=A0A2X0MVR6_9BASI|nr:BZ3500_MvSof-1268-A1-R1_Chr1-3g02461 [Microbotryum saponariae]SCZ96295.1 BZ3501_MvSof-1269-A2-R1_Chr1-3g02064 [Microbotryum saponariae]
MGLISSPLPAYTGAYRVGTLDVEVPVPEPRSFGTALLRTTNEPALQLDTILCTLFYPVEPHNAKGKGRMPWVQRPIATTAQGYAHFTQQKPWLIRLILAIFARNKYLPAGIDAPLLPGTPPSAGTQHTTPESSSSSTSSRTVNSNSSSSSALPLLVFSHGLAGTRTTYSQYCGELASRGYVVAAIEHRDGSGPSTIVTLEQGKEKVVEYIQPDDLMRVLPTAFPPPNPTLSQLAHRREQLVMRLSEIEELVKTLSQINDGEGESLAQQNRRAPSNDPSYGKQLSEWKGRLDFGKMSMVGHSFGGATTLEVLRACSKRFEFTRGVVLDPWVDPIDPVEAQARTGQAKPMLTTDSTSQGSSEEEQIKRSANEIDVPLLAINSEAFTLWQAHYKLVRAIVEHVQAPSWFMTLVGTVHLSFSDFPLLFPLFAKKSGARLDAKEGMTKFVEVSEEFLGGSGKSGKWLGREIVPGDEAGLREGEGYKQSGGKPMEPVGDLRMHVVPEDDERNKGNNPKL